jgi:hypothetical protein
LHRASLLAANAIRRIASIVALRFAAFLYRLIASFPAMPFATSPQLQFCDSLHSFIGSNAIRRIAAIVILRFVASPQLCGRVV